MNTTLLIRLQGFIDFAFDNDLPPIDLTFPILDHPLIFRGYVIVFLFGYFRTAAKITTLYYHLDKAPHSPALIRSHRIEFYLEAALAFVGL